MQLSDGILGYAEVEAHDAFHHVCVYSVLRDFIQGRFKRDIQVAVFANLVC